MTSKRFILSALLGTVVLCTGIVGVLWDRHTLVVEDDDTIVAIDPTMSAEMLFEQGEYYFNHDDDPAGPYDLTLARAYYGAAIDKDVRAHPELWYQLGRIDFLEGKFVAALYKFSKQLEYFDDEVPNVYYMIGLTHGYKARHEDSPEDWELGAAAFSTFIEYRPTAPWPRVDLAWIYFAQGKYEEMKPTLEEGLVHYPDNAWLLNMYGLALMNTGENEAALDHFLRAEAAAAMLTTEDWGNAYPGNDPATWKQGLGEFRGAISKNITLVSQ